MTAGVGPGRFRQNSEHRGAGVSLSSPELSGGMVPPSLLHGWRGTLLFYVLSALLSWSVWGSTVILPALEDWEALLIIVGAYGPPVSALILTLAGGGRRAAGSWLRSVFKLRPVWRWVLLASVLLPVMIAGTHALIFGTIVGDIDPSVDPPWYWALTAAPLNLFVLAWFGSGVEEIGWQGFALPRLAASVPPLVASGIHGIVWAVWHAPLYLVGSWGGENQAFPLLLVITVSLSPVMFWLTKSAMGSVLPAVLFHSAGNLYGDLFEGRQLFAEPLSEHFVEINAALYAVAAVVLIAATRGRLGEAQSRHSSD